MKKTSFLLAFIIALVAFAAWAPKVGAYNAYDGSPSCKQCHPGFNGFGAPLHDAHLALTNNNCSRCHISPGDNPVLDLDAATQSRGCAGCHGRLEDGAENIGAGLRAHHFNAGAPPDTNGLNCANCHGGDPDAPVGEEVFPPFYVAEGLDPCTDSLDGDGNLLYDADDPNCATNTAPAANADAFNTVHNVTLNVPAPGVLGNDTDDDGGPLTAVLDTDVANGTLALNADGSFTYTPNALFAGTDTFTYVANDGVDDSNVATVTIEVTNQAPVSNDDATSTPFETAATIDVLANDTDADGDVLTINFFDANSANGGTVSCNATCRYTPPAGFAGDDTFTYDATDDIAVSNRATVTVTVGAAANNPPVAVDDAFSTVHDTVMNVAAPGVLGNDTDVDGDTLTAALVADVANGTLTLNPDGSFTYTPNASFAGIDTFTYQANDGMADSNVATVTIDVTNAVPVANDDTATTDEDTPVDIDVLANDTDADALTINSFDATSANGGTVSCTVTCRYTPPADFNGTDTFTYDVTDGIDVSNAATVTITVNAVNDPPAAVDDAASTPFDTPVDIDVLANDIDVDGDVLTVDSFDSAGVNGGTVSCDTAATTPTPQCSYTPPAGFSGVDTFTYDATDGIDVSNRATVTVTVGAAANNPPVAGDDVYATDEDTVLIVPAAGVLGNDSDPDGDPITAVLQAGTANGNLILPGDGSFTYTPNPDFNGVDSFTYVANDGQLDSNVATVIITVNPVNDAPIANDDTATTTVDTPMDIDVLANDVDVDGDALFIDDFDPTSANGGTVSCGATCQYTPPAGFTGTDTITYDATDGLDVSNRATVTITVQAVAAVEAEIEAPRIVDASWGRMAIKIEFDDENMVTALTAQQFKIDELYCSGDVSNTMAKPRGIKVKDEEENEFVARFMTPELMLVCEDTVILCSGTLADGTTFEGIDGIRVMRDFERNRCKGENDKDRDDDDDEDHDEDDEE